MSLIPNSWQTPNDFMDKYNPYLTSEEWRVLSYACRHILGWHDYVNSRMRRMSLSFFENGYGPYPGCGLKRAAIIRALDSLAQFGLLAKVGKPTQEGQMWKLPLLESEIDLEGLQARQAEKTQKAVSRTNHARQVKAAVSPTNHQQLVPLTTMQGAGGMSDKLNQSHKIQSQESKPKDSPTPSGAGSDMLGAKPADSPKGEKPFEAMSEGEKVGALIKVYIDGNGILVPKTPRIGKNGKPVTTGNPYANATNRNNALTLIENGITPKDLDEFIIEKRDDAFWEGKEIGWNYILKNIGIWKDTNDALATPSGSYHIDEKQPVVIPPEERVTPEEMALLREKMALIGRGGVR